MTQDEAFKLALERFGEGAIVGNSPIDSKGRTTDRPFVVGAKATYGRWRVRGEGTSFEEAFEDAKKANAQWPDGPPPRAECPKEK